MRQSAAAASAGVFAPIGRPRVPTLALVVWLLLAAPATAVQPVGKDFVWGVASSAFQSEGGQLDSSWHRYAAEGRNGAQPYLNAVDFRHRYKEDIALAKGLGVNAYRFGVSWARVEPRPGEFDQAELAYYDDVVHTIRAAGMTPIPTFQHYDLPGWVLDQGGWKNEQTLTAFVRYGTMLAARWKGLARYWLIFNEPICDINMQLTMGEISALDLAAVADRFARAQAQLYDVIHRLTPGALVSSNECSSNLPTLLSIALEQPLLGRMYNEHKVDFIGIDVYFRADSVDSLSFLASPSHSWTIPQQPYGMYEQIRTYHQRYPRVPIFVTENGMPMGDDEPRPDALSRADHLRDNVYWMQRARDDGITILGYLYWSLTDNYEWGSYGPRFGLYRVDAVGDPALRRQPTDAVHAYRCIVSMGGVPRDYRPVRKQGDGSPSGATNPDPCPATPARAAPQLTKLRLLDSIVRTGLPLRIRFHLDDAARVRLLVRAARSGRVFAIRTVRANAGATRLTWYVRLLRPGRYTLTLTPTGGRGRTVAFRVVGSMRRAPSRRESWRLLSRRLEAGAHGP